MTTTVTVKTNERPACVSGFPCDDDRKPLEDGKYEEIGWVEPNSETIFHVHRNMDLLVQES